jgi:hypothetical protein
MLRGRFVFAAALALVASGAMAATTPVVSTDFTLADATRLPSNWTINGDAGIDLSISGNTISAPSGVALAKNTASIASSMFTNDTFTLPSFTMWADVNVDFHPNGPGVDGTCPADGFAMVFASAAKPTAIGGGGGAIGLYSNPTDLPQFIAAETNTWYGNDLDDTSTCTTGKNVTFEFTNANSDTSVDRNMGGDTNAGGAYINQVTAPDALQNTGLVNGGWYRFQWDVDSTAGTMDLYVTGLDDSNKAIQNMKVNSATFAASAPKFNFAGRFGLTAGTGGGTEGVHVRQVVVVSPAAAGGTQPPSATAGP